MMPPAAQRLVIFDYSGTLSLEAPCFARPEKLAGALVKSGLADVGVTDAGIFWDKIVFPTWGEGSRTTIGYAQVMADRIAALCLPCRGRDTDGEASYSTISRAARRFVAMYLGHSRMDPLWRPLLHKLNADRKIAVVIATDHYAEATGAIIRYLRDWGIGAAKAEGVGETGPSAKEGFISAAAREGVAPEGSAFSLPAGTNGGLHSQGGGGGWFKPLVVANSAELGFWKAEPRFWEILKAQLPGSFQSVLIVDDFGFNEADISGYANPSLVRARRIKTRAVLRNVFETSVSAISFFLQDNEKDRNAARDKKIRRTIRRIEATLRP